MRFAVRFHLHPDVSPDFDEVRQLVLLGLPTGEIWMFRAGGGALALEERQVGMVGDDDGVQAFGHRRRWRRRRSRPGGGSWRRRRSLGRRSLGQGVGGRGCGREGRRQDDAARREARDFTRAVHG